MGFDVSDIINPEHQLLSRSHKVCGFQLGDYTGVLPGYIGALKAEFCGVFEIWDTGGDLLQIELLETSIELVDEYGRLKGTLPEDDFATSRMNEFMAFCRAQIEEEFHNRRA